MGWFLTGGKEYMCGGKFSKGLGYRDGGSSLCGQRNEKLHHRTWKPLWIPDCGPVGLFCFGQQGNWIWMVLNKPSLCWTHHRIHYPLCYLSDLSGCWRHLCLSRVNINLQNPHRIPDSDSEHRPKSTWGFRADLILIVQASGSCQDDTEEISEGLIHWVGWDMAS
jgi:hypothetical protein